SGSSGTISGIATIWPLTKYSASVILDQALELRTLERLECLTEHAADDFTFGISRRSTGAWRQTITLRHEFAQLFKAIFDDKGRGG
ncbi:MAG TPA: hypothetical protein PLX97_09240, partial [Gemmatales bacterium]|nr:hypothetical protein [Gemmatales bacterium]